MSARNKRACAALFFGCCMTLLVGWIAAAAQASTAAALGLALGMFIGWAALEDLML